MLMRPEKAPPQLPRRSDPAALEFTWERFSLIAKEFAPLFKKHWREIALNQDRVLLDPDWDQYTRLDLAGIVRVLTARSQGNLVGYHFVLVFPHLHYASTPWAQSDMFYLDPRYRNGLAGYRLLKIARDALKANGCKTHALNIKLHYHFEGMSRIVKRLGYRPSDMIYTQVF